MYNLITYEADEIVTNILTWMEDISTIPFTSGKLNEVSSYMRLNLLNLEFETHPKIVVRSIIEDVRVMFEQNPHDPDFLKKIDDIFQNYGTFPYWMEG